LQKAELDYDMKYVHVLTDLRDDDNHDFRSLSGSLREDVEHKRRKRWRTLLDAAAMVGIDQVEFQHGLVGGYEAVIREAADEHNIDRVSAEGSARPSGCSLAVCRTHRCGGPGVGRSMNLVR
jgi:hypothetical protein